MANNDKIIEVQAFGSKIKADTGYWYIDFAAVVILLLIVAKIAKTVLKK